MKKFILFLSLFLLVEKSAFAIDIAQCGGLKGHAYYHHAGLIKEKDSGWTEDKISKGVTQLKFFNDGYDIFFIDATKNIVSAKKQGAQIFLLSNTDKDASFVVGYGNGLFDIYRFFTEDSGKNKYALISMKGSNQSFPKSSLMIGDCDHINFESIKE